jgi:HNH endonuclease
MEHTAPFSEEDLRTAISQGLCWADALRYLGYEVKGHNYRTVQKWTRLWGISTDHFDPMARTLRSTTTRQPPLKDVLVEHSSYKRATLKRRLIKDGIKLPVCEMCGQGQFWKERPMSLVLDHINGVPDDNRLENLRIVCPNCNATLDTHCGRNTPRQRVCPGCNQTFAPQQDPAPLLLGGVLGHDLLEPQEGHTAALAAESPATVLGSACRRALADEHGQGRREARRLRQRSPQMAPVVRGGHRQAGRRGPGGRRASGDPHLGSSQVRRSRQLVDEWLRRTMRTLHW